MKTTSLILLAVVLLAGSAGAVMAYRHLNKPPVDYLIQPVELMDIESTVSALGRIADSREIVEASVSESDIFKLHPGQSVFFNLVAVPDSRFEGVVREIKAMPIAAFAPPPQPAKDPDAGDEDMGADPDDPYAETADKAQAMAQPRRKRDIYSSGGEAVFYKVLFDMGGTAGRYPAGMSVMVHVLLGVAKQTPAISIMALGKPVGDDTYLVEVMDAKGRIAPRQVVTGLSNVLSIQVKSGLQVGDKVVLRDNGGLYSPGYKR